MNEIEKNNQMIEARAEQLAERIEALVVEARKKIASTANVAMVYTYFEVGRYIIEDEQGGKVRAEYGKGVLKRVSERLTERLGKGWSVDTLENARNFYNIYAKSEPLVRKSDAPIGKSEPVARILEITENRNQWSLNQRFTLPWSHYLILTHVKDSDARRFYEIEAFEQQWSKHKRRMRYE